MRTEEAVTAALATAAFLIGFAGFGAAMLLATLAGMAIAQRAEEGRHPDLPKEVEGSIVGQRSRT